MPLPQGDGIYIGSLDASAPKLVSWELAGNVAFNAGHLLYGRDRSSGVVQGLFSEAAEVAAITLVGVFVRAGQRDRTDERP